MNTDTFASCQYCGHDIRFARDKGRRYLPFNPDGSRHYCDEYINAAKRRRSPTHEVIDNIDFVEFEVSAKRASADSRPHQYHLPSAAEVAPATKPDGHIVGGLAGEQSEVSDPAASAVSEFSSTSTSITPGRGLPWFREEILLATDLYLRHQGILFGPRHPEVIELSDILKRLPLYPDDAKGGKFRNPNGVAMKLSNIRAVDPHARSKGNVHGSKLDGLYWTELREDPLALGLEIAAIKRRYPKAFERDMTESLPPLEVTLQPTDHTMKVRQLQETPDLEHRVRLDADDSVLSSKNGETAAWNAAIDELRAKPWYETLRKDDPRFDWFLRKFRGHVRPSVLYLHEWLTAISRSPRLVGEGRPDVEEAIVRFREYLLYLHDLTLEEELFSIVSASAQPDHVDRLLRELEWDAGGAWTEGIGIETSMLLHAIKRGWVWTPALDRALVTLRRADVRDARLIGPTLRQHGIVFNASFSARGLFMACQAFGKAIPAVLSDLEVT